VIVFRGEGEKAFVSGADISQFETQRTSAEAVAHYEEIADRAGRAITECEKPTIALIHGFCIGGGVGVALSCDLRIAATDAVFSIPAGRIGLGYRVSSVKKLIDTVGAAKAKEIFFTGDRFDAEHAAEFGLVNQVVPQAGTGCACHGVGHADRRAGAPDAESLQEDREPVAQIRAGGGDSRMRCADPRLF
jgi:enoyl-CoA hydratase